MHPFTNKPNDLIHKLVRRGLALSGATYQRAYTHRLQTEGLARNIDGYKYKYFGIEFDRAYSANTLTQAVANVNNALSPLSLRVNVITVDYEFERDVHSLIVVKTDPSAHINTPLAQQVGAPLEAKTPTPLDLNLHPKELEWAISRIKQAPIPTSDCDMYEVDVPSYLDYKNGTVTGEGNTGLFWDTADKITYKRVVFKAIRFKCLDAVWLEWVLK